MLLPWGRLWRVDKNRSSSHQIDLLNTLILEADDFVIGSIQTSVVLNLFAHYTPADTISNFAAGFLVIRSHWSKPGRSIKGTEPKCDFFCSSVSKINTFIWSVLETLLFILVDDILTPSTGSTAEIAVVGAFFAEPIRMTRKS